MSAWLGSSLGFLRSFARAGLVVGAGAVAFVGIGWVAACGDSGATDGDGGAGGGVSLAGVIYEGGATDEALEALVATKAQDVPAEAAGFSGPAEGAVAASPAPKFTWSIPRMASIEHAPATGAPRHEPGWVELVIGAREAHAHGVPISGRAYFLVFADAAGKPVVRVFTQTLEYTPSEEALNALVAAGPVTASVENAIFEENRITMDGGPFSGTPRTFTVTR